MITRDPVTSLIDGLHHHVRSHMLCLIQDNKTAGKNMMFCLPARFPIPPPPLCIVSRAEYQSVTTGLVLGWSSRKYHPEAMAFKAAQMESRGQYFKPGRAIMNY